MKLDIFQSTLITFLIIAFCSCSSNSNVHNNSTDYVLLYCVSNVSKFNIVYINVSINKGYYFINNGNENLIDVKYIEEENWKENSYMEQTIWSTISDSLIMFSYDTIHAQDTIKPIAIRFKVSRNDEFGILNPSSYEELFSLSDSAMQKSIDDYSKQVGSNHVFIYGFTITDEYLESLPCVITEDLSSSNY